MLVGTAGTGITYSQTICRIIVLKPCISDFYIYVQTGTVYKLLKHLSIEIDHLGQLFNTC